jgi:hypothetical protein
MLVPGCVLAGLVVFCFVGFDHEPRYGGRSLSAWLLVSQQIWSGKLTTPGWQESSDAIRQMGTNGLPYVLDWMAYERPPWRTQVLATLKKLPTAIAGNPGLEKFVLGQGEARAEATIWAFKALGAEARPIVPELFELSYSSKNPATSRRAEAALDNLGADGLAPMLAAIASGKIKHRAGAISWLTAFRPVDLNLSPLHSRLPMPALHEQVSRSSSWGTNAALAVPVLLRFTGDRDSEVAVAAMKALGMLRLDAPEVVPVLADRLKDSRPSVRIAAAEYLSWFGEEARPALPALVEALHDAEYLVRYQVTNSLRSIAPDLFPRKARSAMPAWERALHREE